MSVAIVSASQVAAPLAGVSLDVFALVPRDDRALYATLSTPVKDDLRNWIKWLAPVISAGKKQKGLTARLEGIGRLSGTSAVTARRKWDAYWVHGWKGLVNRSLAGPEWQERANTEAGIARRPEFLQFVRLMFEQNQRVSRPAYKFQLLPRWRKWLATNDPKLAIPGYNTPPRAAEGFKHPAGWSYENLMKHASSRFELKAARIGRGAAYDERPQVYTTRVGLYVGSHYSFDDKWHDFFVNSLAERQAGRPLELCSRDLFAARKLRWGVRVRVKVEGDKYQGLTAPMARMILAATLHLDGYSPRGTVCIIEHGTATFPTWLRAAVTELTGGLVTFSLSGMQGDVAHDGQYAGPSKGNPRHKASHESQNGYEHNVFANLPGQTGKDVVHRPEGLGALLNENAVLLAALDKLPLARAAEIEFPLVSLTEFHHIAHEKYGQIENDHDHNLTDWSQCGHLQQQVWAEGEWRDLPDMDTLPADTRARLVAALDAGTIRTRPRKLSRLEVWRRGASELIKLPGHGVWEILHRDLAAERTVSSNQLAFTDSEIDADEMRFSTRGIDAFGHPVSLTDRETYKVVVNPFAPDVVFIGDAAGRYVGEFRAIPKATRSTEDDPVMQAVFGAAAKREAELLAPLRERHAPEAAEKNARQRRNDARLDLSKPATQTERDAIKRQRKTAFKADDFAAPEQPGPLHPAPTQEAPAVASGEGFWSEADYQPESERPARVHDYDASDFI